MSLSTPDRQALDAIEDGLAESSPSLAAKLATFSRLTADEEMPARETVRVSEPSALDPCRPLLGPQELIKGVLLWLIVTVAVVVASSLGLVFSHGASRTCSNAFALVCTERTNAHQMRPARHQPVLGQAAAARAGPHSQAMELRSGLLGATAARPVPG